MIRIIFKLTAVFFIAMGLYACGGMVQTVKQTFAKDTAHIAFERKDYPTALARFQDAAELGNAEAQYYLSFMYLEGQGTSQDPEKALR